METIECFSRLLKLLHLAMGRLYHQRQFHATRTPAIKRTLTIGKE
jgi:hypothetical protein